MEGDLIMLQSYETQKLALNSNLDTVDKVLNHLDRLTPKQIDLSLVIWAWIEKGQPGVWVSKSAPYDIWEYVNPKDIIWKSRYRYSFTEPSKSTPIIMYERTMLVTIDNPEQASYLFVEPIILARTVSTSKPSTYYKPYNFLKWIEPWHIAPNRPLKELP